MSTYWLGQQKSHSTKIRPKAVGGGILGRFSNVDKCRPEVAGDVIFGTAVDLVGMDVSAKCGDSTINMC